MPGSTPATSQLDWLSSTTAMIVLSWSKATRDLLKSFSWGIGALRQLFASDDGAISFAACPIPSLRWRKPDSNLYGAFPVKWLFSVYCQFFVRSGKAVRRPVAYDQVPGARGRGQGTETLSAAWRLAA